MLNQRMGDDRVRHLFGLGDRCERPVELMLLDEVHTYAGTSGAQVAFLLRRWRQLLRRSVSFVGLSATLADGARFFARLTGLHEQASLEIAPRTRDMIAEGAEYHSWQNPHDPLDVDRNGYRHPLDVLLVINYLTNNGRHAFETEKPVEREPGLFFVDVNGDDIATPLDALVLINHLNTGVENSSFVTAAFSQSYPGPLGVASHSPQQAAATRNSLGYSSDSTYHLSHQIPHHDDSVVIEFSATAEDAGETWGMNNVQVWAISRSHVVTVQSGSEEISIDFGNYCPEFEGEGAAEAESNAAHGTQNSPVYSLQGAKFNDLDANGVYNANAGDMSLEGWTIYLDLNENQKHDNDEPSDVTALDGTYSIALPEPQWRQIESMGLQSGDFSGVAVREVIKNGWQASLPSLVPVEAPAGERFQLRTMVGDINRNPLSELDVGDDFYLYAFIQDTTGDGVFTAYVDISYPSHLVKITGLIEHGPEYFNLEAGDTSIPGLIDEAGGMSGFNPLGSQELLLFRVPMRVTNHGRIEFTVDAPDMLPKTEWLSYGSGQPIDLETEAWFGGTTVDSGFWQK
ncbi:MAG: dockerin type I domain-containing protein, partial [Pirellulaceae bacterium]